MSQRVGGAVTGIERALSHVGVHGPLVEAVADFTVRTSTEGVIEWVSDSISAVLGYRAEDVIGQRADVFLDSAAAGQVSALREKVAAGQSVQGRVRLRHMDGSLVWMDQVSRPIADINGVIIGRASAWRDIQAQVEAEEALNSAERLYRLLAENAADVVVLTGSDGTITWASPSVLTTLGWHPDDLIGRRIRDHIHPSDLERVRRAQAEVLRQGALSGTVEMRFATADGQWRWMSDSGRFLLDDEGGVVGGIDALRDIQTEVEERQTREGAERELAESERHYRQLVESTCDVVYELDSAGLILWVSDSVERVLGRTRSELLGTTPLALIAPGQDIDFEDLLARVDAGVRITNLELRLCVPDGAGTLHERWFSASGNRLADESGNSHITLGSLRDIHDGVEARRARDASDDRFRTAMMNNPNGMVLFSLEGSVLAANPAFCAMLGSDEATIRSTPAEEAIVPEDLESSGQLFAVVASGSRESIQGRTRFLLPDGDVASTEWTLTLIRHPDGSPDYLLAQYENTTDRQRAQDEVARLAHFDAVTGLPNRETLVTHLEAELTTARSHPSCVGLLVVDLDTFHLVNHSLGRMSGDELLRATGHRLQSEAGPDAFVARLTADDFVVVLPDRVNVSEVSLDAIRLQRALGEETTVQGHRIVPSASVGITISGAESTAESLIREAELALREAKRMGRSGRHVFSHELADELEERLLREEEMLDGIPRGEFRVHYQPIVRLSDRSCVGYEALVRWDHPRLGLMSPNRFLAIAEESELIKPLGRWILETICGDMQHLTGQVGINLSAVQLGDPALLGECLATIRRHEVAVERLAVEVTETAVIVNLESAQANLQGMRDAGLSVHMDDFGTGYSSISLLRDLPVSGLKLDQSFTAGFDVQGGLANNLAQGLAGLAAGMGLASIAEGIETEEQATIAQLLGWQLGQGYLFGRPEPLGHWVP